MGAGSGIIKAVKVAVVRWTASLRAPGAWWIGCGALLVVGGRRGWARRPSFHRLAMRKSTCCLLSWVPCSFVIGVSLCLRLCVCVLACVCVCVFVCMLCLSMSVHVSGREDHTESPRCTSRSGRAQAPLPVSDMQGGTRIRGRKLTCWRT